MRSVFKLATEQDWLITVPTAVIAEWWRAPRLRGAPSFDREDWLRSPGLILEPLTLPLARAVGEALSVIPEATFVDAVVMASASLRGEEIVYTSDLSDLTRLQSHFPNVKRLRHAG
jgi:hypothetical protein